MLGSSGLLSHIEACIQRRKKKLGSSKGVSGGASRNASGSGSTGRDDVKVVTLDETGTEVMDISVNASDISIHPLLNSTMRSGICEAEADPGAISEDDVLQLNPSADDLSL